MMNQIDPNLYPLLYSVSQGARWVGQDEFPSCEEWASEHEQRLQFIQTAGVWDDYYPRLQDRASQRDAAFAEIAAAYFLHYKRGLQILDWHPLGANGKEGDLLVGLQPTGKMFVEVKGPGWESEVIEAQGRHSPRLHQSKYIGEEGRWSDPTVPIRRAVDKAYVDNKGHLRLPDSMPTLLIIVDDLWRPLNFSPLWLKIAFFTPKSDRHSTGYLAKDGCFVGSHYDRLGAVGILNVMLMNATSEYRVTIFHNPNALRAVTIPRDTLPRLPPI